MITEPGEAGAAHPPVFALQLLPRQPLKPHTDG
jgi:hypothetical protein